MPAGQPNDPRLKEVHLYLTRQLATNQLPVQAFKRMSDALLMGDRAIERVRTLEADLAVAATVAATAKGVAT